MTLVTEEPDDDVPSGGAATERTRVRRFPKRGHYDRATIHAVIDAGLLCHVGYVIDGQPYVTPTMHWRVGEHVYWHGSSASKMLRAQKAAIPVCVTVSLLDGIVFARSGFNHSINYRCVMALGRAELVEDETEKLETLVAFSDRLAPGRWSDLRPPTKQEMKATTVMRVDLDEAVAKVRSGPPGDDEPDYALPVWAGVLPLSMAVGTPVACPRLDPATPVPACFESLVTG
ncbi:MAG TPA: pyridoxamine 5'-phosphate oxidase family protein [Geminicoccus sp.]|uniref:pyridoxamine 5'-phosphate oxidase family protein n=1 Tax=Geminicoccus sp. TaxID=2024832 RepID=UPI002E30DE99|nr:pyridoxamine 5'-phosphate oxidase family protein [Geminicoccus sp.]HEX2527425.1 pyridoxamine 5'-phosphate oxidase family protein [Geminicoccus sp.]